MNPLAAWNAANERAKRFYYAEIPTPYCHVLGCDNEPFKTRTYCKDHRPARRRK